MHGLRGGIQDEVLIENQDTFTPYFLVPQSSVLKFLFHVISHGVNKYLQFLRRECPTTLASLTTRELS